MNKTKKTILISAIIGAIWSLFGPVLLGYLGYVLGIDDLTRLLVPILFFPNIFSVYLSSLLTCNRPDQLIDVIIGSTQKYNACLGGCCDNIIGFAIWIPLTLVTGAIFGVIIWGLILKVSKNEGVRTY
jgi:hypothetical protein